jgi:hypothetical protein
MGKGKGRSKKREKGRGIMGEGEENQRHHCGFISKDQSRTEARQKPQLPVQVSGREARGGWDGGGEVPGFFPT